MNVVKELKNKTKEECDERDQKMRRERRKRRCKVKIEKRRGKDKTEEMIVVVYKKIEGKNTRGFDCEVATPLELDGNEDVGKDSDGPVMTNASG